MVRATAALVLCVIMLPVMHCFVPRVASARLNGAWLVPMQLLSTKAKPPPHNAWTRHRLERVLSNRGVGSRSQVARVLREGRCKVDGQVVRSSAVRVNVNAVVEVDGVEIKPVPLLAVFNKPVGVECTMRQISHSQHQSLDVAVKDPMVLKVMHPVGRLDADSSGLLLFSSDGQLTKILLTPSNEVPRGYEVVVEGNATYDITKQKLAAGVQTSDGVFTADLLHAAPDEQTNTTQLQLTVTEGKYRMVRRMLHNIGHSVVSLKRTNFGAIKLGDIAEGELRHATAKETWWAKSLLRKPTLHRPKVEEGQKTTTGAKEQPQHKNKNPTKSPATNRSHRAAKNKASNATT